MTRMVDDDDDFRDEKFPRHPVDIDIDNDDDNGVAMDACGYYAALGVPQRATQSDIRRAFLCLSQVYHTDKHSGEAEDVQQLMNERFQQLQEAYMILSDEKQRAAYDAGGAEGVNMLTIIPETVNRAEDVARYVTILEKEKELLTLDRMLAAASSLKVTYSIAHLFVPRDATTTTPSSPSLTAEEKGNDSTSGEPDSTRISTGKETAPADGGANHRNEGMQDAQATAKNTPVAGANTQLSVKLITLDGKERVVLLPSPELENMLRQKMGAVAAGGGNAAADSRVESSATSFLDRRAVIQNVFMAVLPRDIFFQHSFNHMLTPKLNLEVRTMASHHGPKMLVSYGGSLRYTPDDLHTYKTSYQMSLNGIKLKLEHIRQLSNLWILKTKLHVLHGLQLLSQYEVTLNRRLSSLWNLENSLTMSLVDSGLFSTTLTGFADGMQRGLTGHFGYNQLSFLLYRTSPIRLGGSKEKKNKNNLRREGHAYMTENTSLFLLKRLGRVGFEAWYCTSKWQAIGIGFSVDLPFSILPVNRTPRRNEGRAINTISFLYERREHRIEIPVMAFVSDKFHHSLVWLMLPVLCYRVGRSLWRPYQRARLAAMYTQRRLQHQTEMDLARVRAIQEQKAVESASLRNRMHEERIGGLVIINAKYGVLNPRYPESLCMHGKKYIGDAARQRLPWWGRLNFWWRSSSPTSSVANNNNNNNNNDNNSVAHGVEMDSAASPVVVLDVTVALQNFVRDSRLVLPAGSKSKLVGFTDPDPFTEEEKELKVVYRFHRRRHAVTLKENDPVELPRREHLVEA